MAFVKRFQEFFCIFLSEFDKREIVIPIWQKDSLSQREKQSPSPINYSPNNPLIQTKKHRKPMPFWLLYIAPSQAMRKGHRINEFSPQGLPEGVRRYAEWLNSLIAKGILIKICANKFSPFKKQKAWKPMPFAFYVLLSSRITCRRLRLHLHNPCLR